jgi:hypothetical protein
MGIHGVGVYAHGIHGHTRGIPLSMESTPGESTPAMPWAHMESYPCFHGVHLCPWNPWVPMDSIVHWHPCNPRAPTESTPNHPTPLTPWNPRVPMESVSAPSLLHPIASVESIGLHGFHGCQSDLRTQESPCNPWGSHGILPTTNRLHPPHGIPG